MQKSKCVNKCNDNKYFIVSTLAKGRGKKKDVDRGADGVYFSQVPSGQNKCSKFEFGLVAHGTHSSSLCQLPLKVKEKPAQGPPAFSPEKHWEKLSEASPSAPPFRRLTLHFNQLPAPRREGNQQARNSKLAAPFSFVFTFFFLFTFYFFHFDKETLLAKLGSAQEGRDNSANNW